MQSSLSLNVLPFAAKTWSLDILHARCTDKVLKPFIHCFDEKHNFQIYKLHHELPGTYCLPAKPAFRRSGVGGKRRIVKFARETVKIFSAIFSLTDPNTHVSSIFSSFKKNDPTYFTYFSASAHKLTWRHIDDYFSFM